MSLISRIKKIIRPKTIARLPAEAYNLWSETYDHEPNNLMIILDEMLVNELKEGISFRDKIIVDIACGTGRYWNKWLTEQPKRLIGFDVSEGMLAQLRAKYEGAEVVLLKEDHQINLPDAICDVLLSNLALAHFPDLKAYFAEWDRILKTGGRVLITDYHPMALEKGGEISFSRQQRSFKVKHFIYTIPEILACADSLGWEKISLVERTIDASVQHFYEYQNAMNTFKKYDGTKIIFGMVFLKK